MKLRVLSVLLGLLALIVNPAIGCSSSDDSWKFSEADMRSAVAGTYVGTYGNTTETVTLKLNEATSAGSIGTQSISGRRIQCTNRSFIQLAAACMPETSMAISGDLSSNGTLSSSAVTGTFAVYSLDLTYGNLNLTLADGSALTASFDGGKFTNWQLAGLSLALVRQ